MRLCMFTPADSELERGWPGRIDGDHVTQLAAQTLQSYYASGSSAREHAANPTAVRSPGSEIPRPDGRLDATQRLAAVIGANGQIGGWTGLVEWRATKLAAPKDRDFALLLGPVVDTEHEDPFDWEAARALAAENTRLRPGDLLVGPVLDLHEEIASGGFVVSFDGIGELAAFVA